MTTPDLDAVLAHVHAAFDAIPYPGDPFLLGSHDGSEPFEVVGAFVGRTDWRALEPAFLDAHYTALSFLSEAGFRFYLPAYLVADVRGALQTADPVFHLTHGLIDETHEERIGERTFTWRSGRSSLLNPRRYGAATWWDHVQARLGAFTREEAGAIVTYLEHAAARSEINPERDRITRALDAYWRDRARTAPTAADLARHLAAESELHAGRMARYRP